MANMEMNQHKRMAEGESLEGEPSFGCETLHGKTVEHMDAHDGTDSAHLHDHERAAPQPVKHTEGKMAAQANADHGPHHMHKSGAHHAPMARETVG